jgi:hypothetical protein
MISHQFVLNLKRMPNATFRKGLKPKKVTLEEAFTFAPSFHASLASPEDDPLPPMDELLRISISATRPFVQ